jgi:two-component system, sensor histidine kinase and response regulator
MAIDTITDENPKLSFEKKEKYLILMKEVSKNSFHLLENLLNWARSQQKLVSFEFSSHKISELINENINILNSIAKDKSILIKNDVDGTLEAVFDRNSISTVIRNLISNALKFTKSNGEIIIKGEKAENSILISVKDSGIGMTSENTKKLFRQNSVFSTTGTEGEKGTGLGLLICKDFVENNHGRIWVESELGKGTIFFFTIPLDN